MSKGGRTVRQQCRGLWRTAASLFALTLIAPLAIGGGAGAQTISVSGSPGTIRVSTAIAGGVPATVIENTTTYTVSTPNSGTERRIRVKLNSALPAGVTLTVSCQAPPNAVSTGTITLTTANQDLVMGIDKNTNVSGLTITYTLTAPLSVGVMSSQTRNVTFTVATGG
jgi:hypothetical protein